MQNSGRCFRSHDHENDCPCGQALLRSLSQLVKRMGAAGADTLLETPLLPCLVQAFGHASADVRKAVRHFYLCQDRRPGIASDYAAGRRRLHWGTSLCVLHSHHRE